MLLNDAERHENQISVRIVQTYIVRPFEMVLRKILKTHSVVLNVVSTNLTAIEEVQSNQS